MKSGNIDNINYHCKAFDPIEPIEKIKSIAE